MARRMERGAVGSLFLLLGLGYVALLLNFYFNQADMLYLPDYPGAGSDATPFDVGLEYQAVAFKTEDGVQLDAWLVPAESTRGVVLICHGNAGTISNRLSTLKLFNQLGFSSFIFDYRGYGRSQGETSEAGTYLDAEAAWRYLRQQGFAEDEIVIFGRSLGGAVAANLARQHAPAALILESSFTSVPDVAAELYPLFPVRWLSRFRYDTLDYLQSITAPTLVVHSRQDGIIPFSHGQRLFAAATEPKQFIELSGGHNDAIFVSKVVYRQGLDRFFNQYIDQR